MCAFCVQKETDFGHAHGKFVMINFGRIPRYTHYVRTRDERPIKRIFSNSIAKN